MTKKDNIVKGFKGFDKNLRCNGGNMPYQYEIGKIYKEDVEPKCCRKGFHFCEYPLDVFRYYEPCNGNGELNRFCEVEALGDIDRENDCTKIATNKIKIGAEINFQALTKASIKFIYEHAKKTKCKGANLKSNNSVASNTGDSSVASNTGYCSVASNTGDSSVASNTGDSSVASNTGNRSVASNTGDSSVASNTGYCSVASNTGENGIASSLGIQSKAKGSKGTWLVLAEWIEDDDWNWKVKEVKTVQVDGKKIKEDTLYQLINGNFVEVEDVDI